MEGAERVAARPPPGAAHRARLRRGPEPGEGLAQERVERGALHAPVAEERAAEVEEDGAGQHGRRRVAEDRRPLRAGRLRPCSTLAPSRNAAPRSSRAAAGAGSRVDLDGAIALPGAPGRAPDGAERGRAAPERAPGGRQAEALARGARGPHRRGAAAEGRGGAARARGRGRAPCARGGARGHPELRAPRRAGGRRGRRPRAASRRRRYRASTSRRATTWRWPRGSTAIDFEGGARVAGQKWYFLKNDLVLLELALQRYALDVLLEDGFTPFVTPDVARPEIVDGLGYAPARPGDADLLARERRPLPRRHRRDHARRAPGRLGARGGGAAAQVRGPLALLPHRGRLPRAREQGPLPGAPVHEGRDVRVHAPRGVGGDARAPPRPRGAHLPGARDPVPRGRHRRRRPRRAGLPEVRPRGLDARARRRRRLRRGDVHLELHRLPGAPPARPLPAQGRQAHRATSTC